jgi:hypothetical protein
VILEIGGREYLLSQRRASAVLELVAVAKQRAGAGDTTDNVLVMAQIVRDSLGATYKGLGRIRGFRYRQFLETGGVVLLLDSLSVSELSAACRYIVEELEGNKKKVEEIPEGSQ